MTIDRELAHDYLYFLAEELAAEAYKSDSIIRL